MTTSLMEDLRDRFRETSRVRVEEMALLLDMIERHPDDSHALRKLAKHFHGLAGMGATYGFPRVSQLGDEAEAVILPLAKRGEAPAPALVERWRELVEEISADLWRDGALPPGPDALKIAPPPPFEVLLVESDRFLAAEIVDALEREELSVRVCPPADAVAELERRVPDALILDAQAWEVIETLRGLEGGACVGAIVTGAAADFTDKVRAIRSGADAFMSKPLDMPTLVRRVAALRERKEHPARRILAVEDDATTAALIRGFLSAAGYEVEICRDPSQFESTMLTFQPDLVLMDVQLTDDVSGHDLVRYLRQSERFSTLPVIIVTSDGERRAILESTSAGADLLVTKPVDWDLLLSQIAARLERASVVRELTDRDPLTGVLTRAAFEARVRQRMAGEPGGVLVLIDLDHFKAVNDTWGHIAGDRVLAALGTLLRRGVRKNDVVSRYGGEEFALLLEEVSVEDAVHLCERLLSNFATLEHNVTFSAGVAKLEGSFDETFRLADAALYEAKRAGRARVIAA